MAVEMIPDERLEQIAHNPFPALVNLDGINAIVSLLTEVRRRRVAARLIRQLHTDRRGYCATCDKAWPCMTLRVIEGEVDDQNLPK